MRASSIAIIAGLGIALSATAAVAEFPESPIEVIIPYGAGGNSDTAGRILINAMREVMDADFVPLNVEGAGGTIGTAQLAASDADGYTLGFNPIATVTIQPHLRPLPYDDTSFAPVCMVVDNPSAVTVAPDSPYQTMDDLIAAVRAGENIVAVGGAPGSMTHISQAMIANAYDVSWTYLPAGGGGRAAASIMSGEATFATDTSAMEAIHGLRTLAVTSTERVPGLENVPTLQELGVDVVSTIWFGLFAPAGTPAEVLDTLSAACEAATATDSFIDGMASANYIVRYMGREEFTTFFEEEYARNRELLPVIGVALPAQ